MLERLNGAVSKTRFANLPQVHERKSAQDVIALQASVGRSRLWPAMDTG